MRGNASARRLVGSSTLFAADAFPLSLDENWITGVFELRQSACIKMECNYIVKRKLQSEMEKMELHFVILLRFDTLNPDHSLSQYCCIL